MAFGRMAVGLGWAAVGALALGATARALFRSGRTPSEDVALDVPEPDGQEPDVLLDVSELEVDRINLEVDDLRAHVSILAELANLLNLSVGVDARLAQVKLEIEGVEAKVLLKVRLKHVRAILEKALDTIAEQPEILRILSQSLSTVVRESLGEAQTALDEVLEGLQVGEPVDEALRGKLGEVRATLQDILGRQELESAREGAARRALGVGPPADGASSASEGESREH
jgi:exonuclease VII small subunit